MNPTKGGTAGSPRHHGTARIRLALLAGITAVALPITGAVTATAVFAANPDGSTTTTSQGHNTTGNSDSSHGKSASTSTSSGTSNSSTTASSHGTSGNAGTSGTVTSPQPLSNADQNPGGANNGGNCGAYCSTRSGLPSMNGNGNGQATGKPCAGCVGKADNKNPQGQFPNGSDHNAGYECDRNHGIGRTNPAHTGCTPATPPPTCTPSQSNNFCGGGGGGGGGGCVETSTHSCSPCVVTATNTCGSGGSGCVESATHSCTPCVVTSTNTCSSSGGTGCVATAANDFCSTVLGTTTTKATTGNTTTGATTSAKAGLPTTVLGQTFTKSGGAHALPFTGLNTLALIGLVLALFGGGLGLFWTGRVRSRRNA